MIKTYYLAKIFARMRLSSFRDCEIDKTAKIMGGCAFAKARIGRYTYVCASSGATDAHIGNFCSIGGDVHIGGGIHPQEMVSTSPAFLRGRNPLRKNFADIPYTPSKTVEIGNDVWIGQGAYIKAGMKIGSGAIIGAHAVVTHDVEPYSIVAGIPAKEIRKRFDDETIQKLLALEWWNWPDDRLKKYGSYFETPELLFKAMEND